MVKAVVKSDLAAATRSFKQLLEISSMEGQRLTALMKARTELYGILAARSGCLGQIEPFCDSSALNENGRLQQLSLSTLSETDCFALFSEDSKAALMVASAATHEASFREAVASLVFAFNKAGTTADICTEFTLNPSAFPLELRATELQLVEGSADLVVGRFADVREMQDTDVVEKSVSLNRATLVFADPFVLALFHAALTERHTIVQVLNALGNEAADNTDASSGNGLTVTVDLDGSGWLAEVALELRDIDAIKRQMEVPLQIGACTSLMQALKLASVTSKLRVFTGLEIGDTIAGTGP